MPAGDGENDEVGGGGTSEHGAGRPNVRQEGVHQDLDLVVIGVITQNLFYKAEMKHFWESIKK